MTAAVEVELWISTSSNPLNTSLILDLLHDDKVTWEFLTTVLGFVCQSVSLCTTITRKFSRSILPYHFILEG